jgi:enolase-phosphatase E1
MVPKLIVLDIEGTVSPVTFVKNVLFPYAFHRLDDYLSRNAPRADVQRILLETRWMYQQERGFWPDMQETIVTLGAWSKQDRKAPPLKRLQGLIWEEGFAKGILKAPLYPDVAPTLRKWHKAGIQLSVFSSGSVHAQQQFFGHSTEGDLRPLMSGWADTETAGPKRVAASYSRIAEQMRLAPHQVFFFSDIAEEVAAALEAGWRAAQVVRPGTEATPGLLHVNTLEQGAALW